MHFDKADGLTKIMQLLDAMCKLRKGTGGKDVELTMKLILALRRVVKFQFNNIERLKSDVGYPACCSSLWSDYLCAQ